MCVRDYLKLFIACGVLISTSFLMYVKVVDSDAGLPIVAALLGYVFGNSHAVLESKINGGE